ncbi:hypothetical protein BDZ94DRAFT_1252313 [Collybia nuda]|uniref:G-patch domain-containing protein n=1 Tax=Collybia nuda TaxID=64659 RepID=A0A9P5YA52_9AGAR|nr:hypothetical protein BDZ94DRAFT_1252313 [Collybia nuda]
MSGSRLKRKLGDLGVDTSSRKANESFCLIGTPLPPLEKSKDTGEFVPLWKQDVRDEKGRRRLHGAFTGGFSAGYFNSVGSKEGWTPSTFVSSRGERAKQKAARPEDFMDEEDLQELKDSRVLVDTTDEMDFSGGNKVVAGDSEQDSIASALEASLLPPPTESAGARILKKMGWRLGQGIGPRITLRQRKLQDMEASFGSRITGDVINIPEDDEEGSKHTYAPRDTRILLVDRKDNAHGLGYHPGMGLNESLGVKGSNGPVGPKLAAGFGLGALNDADEDDLDVYDGGPNNNRRREAYDNVERADDENIVIGDNSGRSQKSQQRPASFTSIFRDGRPVLAGFIITNKPVSEDRWFPLPDVPKGWTPDPRRIWDKQQNKENIQKPAPSQAHGKWKSGISADERGSMLGETPLPSAPRSVFEFMSQKDRERLQKAASHTRQPPQGQGEDGSSSSMPPPRAPLPPDVIRIARTEPHIAQAALRGFQPFAADPTKQARYKVYLESQASQDSSTPSLKPTPGQRIDEFNKEVEDYAKAALLFKPMSGAMAGRFTSAAVIDHGPKIHEGLHTPSAEEIEKKEEEERQKAEDNISPKAHAAKISMYGPLTREIKPWQPAKLLCKRFGVKDPNPMPEAPADTPLATGTAASGSDVPQSEATASTSTSVFESSGTQRSGPKDLANVGLGEDDDQGRDTLTYERPEMDVYKAIFASDDEDSDDEEPAEEPENDTGENTVPLGQDQTEETAIKTPNALVELPPPDVPVDPSTFKPTFIPRDNKTKKSKDKGKEKERKEKRKKEKKTVLVSFEMDEEGGTVLATKPSKDRPKKKKRRDKGEGDDDDAMWVEKPAPNVVKDLPLAHPPSDTLVSPNGESADSATALQRGRKRAVDFL